MKKKDKKTISTKKAQEKSDLAAKEKKLLQLTQQEAIIIQRKIKAEGAAEGIDNAVGQLVAQVPRLLEDKEVLNNLRTVVKSAEAVGGNKDVVLKAIGNWFLQKVVLGLSDMSGDLGKQAKMLSGSLRLVQLEKNSLGGQNGSDSGKVKS